ncbi:hypothetical protein [Nocardia nova]|nr:hypothetical protein [Nocardia nova]
MILRFLGKGGSGTNDCPTLYATDQDTYVVIGWVTDTPGVAEIPHLLLGYLEPDHFLDTPLTDTGRGTFTLSGRPVTERATLDQMTMETYETAIEVPKRERTFYGAIASRQSVA